MGDGEQGLIPMISFRKMKRKKRLQLGGDGRRREIERDGRRRGERNGEEKIIMMMMKRHRNGKRNIINTLARMEGMSGEMMMLNMKERLSSWMMMKSEFVTC